jgi:hypothetical protein
MLMFGRRKHRSRKNPPPVRKAVSPDQHWDRSPKPHDALMGYAPELGLVSDDRPPEVYPDEIEPDWSDPETTPEA